MSIVHICLNVFVDDALNIITSLNSGNTMGKFHQKLGKGYKNNKLFVSEDKRNYLCGGKNTIT